LNITKASPHEMSKNQKSNRKTDSSRMVTLWVPHNLAQAVEAAIAKRETDRSKWIREAMRDKAARESIPT